MSAHDDVEKVNELTKELKDFLAGVWDYPDLARWIIDRQAAQSRRIEELEKELSQQKEFFDAAYKDSEYFQKHYRITEQILTECHAEINKAIMSEDGFDGSDGLELLKKIEKEFPHLKQAFSGDGEKEVGSNG